MTKRSGMKFVRFATTMAGFAATLATEVPGVARLHGAETTPATATKMGSAEKQVPAAMSTGKAAAPKELKLAPVTSGWRFKEVRRYVAPEARQGVAVDAEFFYAINNHTIGKYRKDTGTRVALWEGGDKGEIIHLNAGGVFDGKLYTVHSNYPAVPMLSSVEIFDPGTLTHAASHSFGRMDGSFTWLDRRDGKWIACFVHYGARGAEPGRDPAWTQIVAFDSEWRRTGGWALPADFMALIGEHGYSASGGAFGPDGYLYLTGHDNPQLYVMAFPKAGSTLRWIATLAIPAEGQAFAWDPVNPDQLYVIARKTREVVVGRVSGPDEKR